MSGAARCKRRAAAIAYAHKLAGFEPPINESVKAVMRDAGAAIGSARFGGHFRAVQGFRYYGEAGLAAAKASA